MVDDRMLNGTMTDGTMIGDITTDGKYANQLRLDKTNVCSGLRSN